MPRGSVLRGFTYNCPECGRFCRDGWELSYSEFSAMWGAFCTVHGEWRDAT